MTIRIPAVCFVETLEEAKRFIEVRDGDVSPEEAESLAKRFGDDLLDWWSKRYPPAR